MQLLLVTHADTAYDRNRCTNEFVVALRDLVDLHIAELEDMSEHSGSAAADAAGVDLACMDALLMFARFRFRLEADPFNWVGFAGRRVWLEHDAWLGYGPSGGAWQGTFASVYHRDGFDQMITTGRTTRDLLRSDGVNAEWVPKGFNSWAFHDAGGEREGACTFGTAWPSRKAMVHRVRRRGVNLKDVSGPYSGLNDRLNAHAAGLVCNKPGKAPLGKAGRAVARLWPEFVRTYPAVEPMIKTFEVAAAGCGLVVDQTPELDELGFVHGDTCLTYETFDEAADLLLTTPEEELIEIGRRASKLAHDRHTWRHRASEVVALLG